MKGPPCGSGLAPGDSISRNGGDVTNTGRSACHGFAAREFPPLPDDESKPDYWPTPNEEQRAALISRLDVHSWADMDIPEPDRLLGDVLTTTSRMFLVGRTGLGKTLLGLGIAAGVASGTGFLHWPGGWPARVVYLDGEMPAELIKPRSRDALRRLKGAAVPRGNLLIFGRDIESAARRDFPTLPRDQGLALRVIAEKMKVSDVSISHAGVKNALTAADRQQVPS